jgi:enoyl-[acyl-carrier-protein] reductase (NADH)
MSATLSADKVELLHRQSVWNKEGSAREVVGAVKWLLSDEAQAVTGQIIHCDGRL